MSEQRDPAHAREVLSDEQGADIPAFLRSLPESRAAADISLLNP
jgi:hypothetical protein